MYQMSRIPFDKLTASGGGCGICISNLRYSITQSAISPANVTIGGKATTAEQLKDVATTANANSLATIFDVQAVQMELASTVADVGALATNVVSTAMQRSEYVKRDEALKAAEDNLKATDPVAWQTYQAHPSAQALVDIEFNQALQTNPVLKAEYEALPKDKQDTFVQDQINQGKGFGVVSNAEAAWHQTQNQYGPGSDFSRTAQALSGLAAGLASGNTEQALSNLTQPYLASAIGTYFDKLELQPDGTKNHEYAPERLLAHAAAGAVVAYFSGNNATSGATGAVSGETMAMLVHQQLYDNKPTDQLTTAEKESIRAVATLASGLAGALQGGSFESAATSAAAGYNAAVNNDTREQGAYDAPDQIQTISREIRKGNFKQMDETRIQSLTSQLESISGTTKYKEYQQAVMQTDGPNSVFIVSPTSRAAGVSTMSRPTAIGDIVYMDGGTQAIVTGQNADGTFRARPTTSKENSTIAGFANGVQSASYISGFVTSLAQATASAATTPRTGSSSVIKPPKSNAIPEHVADTVDNIYRNNIGPSGFKGGKVFKNDGRGGGAVLPKVGEDNKLIQYKEYDVNRYYQGVNRGSERVVFGSDGKVYYTDDHYSTFVRVK